MPKDNSDKLKGQKPGTKGSGRVGQSGDLQQDQSGKEGRVSQISVSSGNQSNI